MSAKHRKQAQAEKGQDERNDKRSRSSVASNHDGQV
jgi:hypothetical protein